MSRPKNINPERLIGWKFTPSQGQFTENEAILYALSIGFNSDPLKTSDFKYTYERDDGFIPFPTFSTCVPKIDLFKELENIKELPESFNPYKILHGTQRIQMIHPQLKPNVKYVARGEIKDVQDKGKISILFIQIKTYQKLDNGNEDLACINTMGIVMIGVGGFGYSGNNSTISIPKQPQRNPDLVLKDKSFPNQALFYRLNGDHNPLHIDPNASAMLGFDVPILHGLASNGIIARCLVQNLLEDNPVRMKSIHCRFVGHVFPGQSYEIKVWKEKGYFYFVASVVERGKDVVIGTLETKQMPKL